MSIISNLAYLIIYIVCGVLIFTITYQLQIIYAIEINYLCEMIYEIIIITNFLLLCTIIGAIIFGFICDTYCANSNVSAPGEGFFIMFNGIIIGGCIGCFIGIGFLIFNIF